MSVAIDPGTTTPLATGTVTDHDGTSNAKAQEVLEALATGSASTLSLARNTPNDSGGTITKATAKASAGNVYAVFATNTNTALRYLQLHNKATTPAGGDTAARSWPIPGGSISSPGYCQLNRNDFGPNGYYLSSGVSWAISTTPATFTDAATAAEHLLDVGYL